MIIARIESLIAGKSIDDALARAAAYVEAGADGIMIHSKNKSGTILRNFVKDSGLLTYLLPLLYTYYLQSHNRNRIGFMGCERSNLCKSHVAKCIPSMVNCAKSILMHERSQEAVNDYCMPIKEILELIPGTKKH